MGIWRDHLTAEDIAKLSEPGATARVKIGAQVGELSTYNPQTQMGIFSADVGGIMPTGIDPAKTWIKLSDADELSEGLK